MSTDALKPLKLFARNLTARADVVVRGNPVTTRPESGVENAWPGLEFDHRNIDKYFFAGLVFEYHDEQGAILREFDPKSAAAKFFKHSDIQKGIFLAFVQGNVTSRPEGSPPQQQVFSFAPPAALENWRIIRDFEKGPVAIALCTRTTYNKVLADTLTIEQVTARFVRRIDRKELGMVFLFGERAEYLDRDGVIDPEAIGPGNLTRSMCSPWQYDFTDCGCFFWAANKPDMVSSAEQPLQILNFQRRDRSDDAKRKPTDWIVKDELNWDERNVLRHVDLINHFNDLKFVISGRETDEYVPVVAPTPANTPFKLLSRKQIIDRLKVLATVEHALCVEYLYAYYSLRLPPGTGPRREPWSAPGRPPKETDDDARIFTAADEVLRVAIDEMRHFRWVNEMLIDLGQPWVLGRAKKIGKNFPGQPGFNQSFALVPLAPKQLDWFIKVEKASANHRNPKTIDGMYTRILLSIEEGPAFAKSPAQRDRLAQYVKAIIDEGLDHYHRFVRVQEALAGMRESKYLRVRTGPRRARAGSAAKILQDTVDGSYAVLLRSLDYVFQQGDQQRGAMLEAARRAMYNIDDACRSLSEQGFGGLFNLPRMATAKAGSVKTPRDIGQPLRRHLTSLRKSKHPDLRALADRMDGKLAELTESIATTVRQTKP